MQYSWNECRKCMNITDADWMKCSSCGNRECFIELFLTPREVYGRTWPNPEKIWSKHEPEFIGFKNQWFWYERLAQALLKRGQELAEDTNKLCPEAAWV